MKTDATRRAAIRSRAEKATKGPWRNDHPSWKDVNDITVWCGPEGEGAECLCNMGYPIAACDDKEQAEQSWNNGEFVAHARTDIPDLLADLDEAVGLLKEAADFIATLSNELLKGCCSEYDVSDSHGDDCIVSRIRKAVGD